jgi:hypothetical protein
MDGKKEAAMTELRALRPVPDPPLMPACKRLESWRGTLGVDPGARSSFSISVPAAGKRLPRTA